jgi:putative ABC transport system permease protein
MNILKLLRNNLYFYRRTHLGVVLGVALCTAILIGALIVGDSIKYSLKQIVYARLGNTHFALQSGDRFFRSQLADDVSTDLNTITAPLLQTRGIAISNGGEYRSNKVHIYGVDVRFDKMGNLQNVYADIQENELLLNSHLAALLNAQVGDEILVRIERLDAMPKDAPLALDTDLYITRRFLIKDIVTDEKFGRFGTFSNQVAPHNIFVSLSAMNEIMDIQSSANVLLVSGQTDFETLSKSLNENFQLADAGLELVGLLNEHVELRSNRIFIDRPIANFVLKSQDNANPIFTYFVNGISFKNKSTPYSFVSALGNSVITDNLADDEIIINSWLALDLSAKVGDKINVSYFVIGPKRSLVEKTTTFIVKQIVPIKGPYADRSLMPDFPGLADEDNCRDWDAGIPIDYDKIRDKDEQYWDDFHGTPKAFVNLKKAQELWSNRFGELTAIRFPNSSVVQLESTLSENLDPQSIGFVFSPVLQQGLNASTHSVDFAQLFLGLSFFIIIAALLLMGMLFVFGVEQRSQEIGLLLALGFSTKLTSRIIILEGLVLAILGGLVGVVLGVLYNQIILWALKSMWINIVGTSALQIYINPLTVLTGFLISVFIAVATMWLVFRKQSKRPIAFLQKGDNGSSLFSRIKVPIFSYVLGIISILMVIIILATTSAGRGKEAAAAYFTAGSLMLIGAIALCNIVLYKLNRSKANFSLFNIGMRNNSRRRLRSLTLVGLLASGLFVVFTVGANRHSPAKNAQQRDSGTGGFAFWGESTIPVLYDLNSQRGKEFYSLDKKEMANVEIVQLKVKEGDDASCLNLNRTSIPQLIGVDSQELDRRQAFTFVKKSDKLGPQNSWSALDQDFGGNIVPGFADQTVIIWGLGKSVGDTLFYVDENGQEFGVKLVGGLANSLFQGNVLISEKNFIKKYPSKSGYNLFLVDVSPQRQQETAKSLTWALQDQGFDLTPSTQRLEEFSKVENTYLSIFLILGGFGMVIGSIGIGIVVMRNVMERRGELALLRAVGFQRTALLKMLLAEFIVLLMAGIGIGILAALCAVLPALMSPGAGIPYVTIFITLIFVVFSGLFFTFISTRLAIRGNLLSALRNE